MLGRILALLTALAAIVQHFLNDRARRRAAEEAREIEEHKRAIDEDPAAWFAGHFSAGGGADGVRSGADSDVSADSDSPHTADPAE